MSTPVESTQPSHVVDMEQVTAQFLMKVGADPALQELRLRTVLKMAELYQQSLIEVQVGTTNHK